ncbi:MAG: DUF4399 domain-containing protein [Bacteroidia bacterium]
MKALHLFVAAIMVLFTACSQSENSSSNESHPGHDHDHMAHSGDVVDTTGLGVSFPEGAAVFFKNLEDGQQISLPFTLEMGVEGMEVEAAGPINYGKGHHHLIIGGDFMALGTSVPFDGQHLHFGKGQTEMVLDSLPAGKHKLTLQFANGAHLSYGEALSTSIFIEVTE